MLKLFCTPCQSGTFARLAVGPLLSFLMALILQSALWNLSDKTNCVCVTRSSLDLDKTNLPAVVHTLRITRSSLDSRTPCHPEHLYCVMLNQQRMHTNTSCFVHEKLLHSGARMSPHIECVCVCVCVCVCECECVYLYISCAPILLPAPRSSHSVWKPSLSTCIYKSVACYYL